LEDDVMGGGGKENVIVEGEALLRKVNVVVEIDVVGVVYVV
jgi:hypothetical protein